MTEHNALSRRRLLTGGATVAAVTAAGGLGAAGRAHAAETWETVLNTDSFASYQSLEANWNYRYPWGSDHNGSARMYASPSDHNHVFLSGGGVLTLLATRINWDEGTSSSTPHLPIRYHSGAIHAKHQITVTNQFPNYEVKGEFQAPSAPGTWPAFWLTGVNSWPPESDILEFKGDNRNWFNTFRTSSDVSSTIVPVSSPGSWHGYRAWITKVNNTDVDIHYYLDGTWKAVHRGAGFVGKPLWLIYNLQMEGSSGNSGPTSDTYYRARNVYIGRTRVS
ncbi:glycoside hydrolase [Streptomyces millisiae]|uniref:Glycoside hydrolase n=1 Tax=Streptomyces millisiae TaxID=3075542 RepID=A0ABU2LJX9_9ACTN|nr:glycoside hydrolase [Streptomyces sp. DSM 44918]MDT0317890.1 glycoside hydrolase [Streptomyces sp. DSM 44918]